MKGSTRKYVDRKCLLYSKKFVYIYIYVSVKILKKSNVFGELFYSYLTTLNITVLHYHIKQSL